MQRLPTARPKCALTGLEGGAHVPFTCQVRCGPCCCCWPGSEHPSAGGNGGQPCAYPSPRSKPVPFGLETGTIDGQRVCLHVGEFCKPKADRQYRRYGFRCIHYDRRVHRYRLTRAWDTRRSPRPRTRRLAREEGPPKSGQARSVPLIDIAARALDGLRRRERFALSSPACCGKQIARRQPTAGAPRSCTT